MVSHMAILLNKQIELLGLYSILTHFESTSMQISTNSESSRENGAHVRFSCAILENRAPSRRTVKIYVRRI